MNDYFLPDKKISINDIKVLFGVNTSRAYELRINIKKSLNIQDVSIDNISQYLKCSIYCISYGLIFSQRVIIRPTDIMQWMGLKDSQATNYFSDMRDKLNKGKSELIHIDDFCKYFGVFPGFVFATINNKYAISIIKDLKDLGFDKAARIKNLIHGEINKSKMDPFKKYFAPIFDESFFDSKKINERLHYFTYTIASLIPMILDPKAPDSIYLITVPY